MADTAPKQAATASVTNEGLWQPLYPLVLGADWHKLDAGLQAFHGTTGLRGATGVFEVRHGDGRLARLLAWLFRLPAPGRAVSIAVAIHCESRPGPRNGIVEIWDRSFGAHKIISEQSIGDDGLLLERFGLLELSFKLTVEDGTLCFHPVAADIAIATQRVTLPHWLSPKIEARVHSTPQRPASLAVSVKLFAPWIGLLLSYEGEIEAAKR